MQIVIDIPESIYDTIQADEMISREQLAVLQMHILNGTPLPTDAVDRVTIKEYLESFEVAQPKMVSSSENPNKWVGADVLNHWIGAEVLDKIRSEIEQEYKIESAHPYGQGLRRALEIIGKYTAEGSE